MQHSIILPFLDETGLLTPIVITALEEGATSVRNPDNYDTITLTFKSKKDKDAFVAKLPKKAIEEVPVEGPEASD